MNMPKELLKLPEWAAEAAFANIRQGVVTNGQNIISSTFAIRPFGLENQTIPAFLLDGVQVFLKPEDIVQYEGATLVAGHSVCMEEPSKGYLMLVTDGSLNMHLFRAHDQTIPIAYRPEYDSSRNWGYVHLGNGPVDGHYIPINWRPTLGRMKWLNYPVYRVGISLNPDSGGVSGIYETHHGTFLAECYEGNGWVWTVDWKSDFSYDQIAFKRDIVAYFYNQE